MVLSKYALELYSGFLDTAKTKMSEGNYQGLPHFPNSINAEWGTYRYLFKLLLVLLIFCRYILLALYFLIPLILYQQSKTAK